MCVPDGQRCSATSRCCTRPNEPCPWSNYCGCSPPSGPCQFSGGVFPCCAGLSCQATNGGITTKHCVASSCLIHGTRCEGQGECCAGLRCLCPAGSGADCFSPLRVCLPPRPGDQCDLDSQCPDGSRCSTFTPVDGACCTPRGQACRPGLFPECCAGSHCDAGSGTCVAGCSAIGELCESVADCCAASMCQFGKCVI